MMRFLICLVFFSHLCGYAPNSFWSVYEDSPYWDSIGYDNTDSYLNGEYRFLKCMLDPNQIVFDVGANLGDWSAIVDHVQPTSTIYAFEPQPATFAKLKARLFSSNVRCFNLALSSTISSSIPFYVYGDGKGDAVLSSLYKRPILNERKQREPGVIHIRTDTLSHLCENQGIEHIDLLKIDTEGAEWEVLQGAAPLIEKQCIEMIQFEYGGTYPDAGITLKELFEFLTFHGYTLYRQFYKGLIEIKKWRPQLETYHYANYVALSPTKKLRIEKQALSR